MTTTEPARKTRTSFLARRSQRQREGVRLLLAMVALMWVLEIINSVDSYNLSREGGIVPRDFARLWDIFTAPFLHASFGHLIANTIPFVFMGLIIAIRGAARVAVVTLIVVVIGGLGTWLIAPAHSTTVGASGLVFGFAAYLLTRGFFNRRALELLTGAIVAVIWGGALLISLVPHYGVSWQGHLCGAIGGVLAARLLAQDRARPAGGPARALAK